MAMKQEQRLALQKHHSCLIANINPLPIAMTLVKENILFQYHFEEIEACSTRTDQVYKLLAILRSRGSVAYDAFCKALLAHGHHQEAGLLCPELQQVR
jgi:hypothetical protein